MVIEFSFFCSQQNERKVRQKKPFPSLRRLELTNILLLNIRISDATCYFELYVHVAYDAL